MRVIKKYPNRRLYDTEKSVYITVTDVHRLIRDGVEFQVVDAVSGEDITRSILVQIIIDQENGETPMFTTDMLTKFIRFYEDGAQNLFGEFLEKNMQFFAEQQKRMMEGNVVQPFAKMMQDMTERNMAIWQEMQKNFMNFGARPAAKKDDDKKKS